MIHALSAILEHDFTDPCGAWPEIIASGCRVAGAARGAVLGALPSGEWTVVAFAEHPDASDGSTTTPPLIAGQRLDPAARAAMGAPAHSVTRPITGPDGALWGELVLFGASAGLADDRDIRAFADVLAGLCRLILARSHDVTIERERANTDVEHARSRVDHVVERAGDGQWDWPIADGDPVWFSPQYARLLGYEPDDLPVSADGLCSHVHPDDAERVQQAIDAALRDDAAYDITHRLRSRDGSHRWFQARGHVRRNDDGTPQRFTGFIHDLQALLDARDAFEASDRGLRQILDAVPSYVYYKDDRNRILNLNRAAAEAMQMRVEDVVGRPTEDFFPADDAADFLRDDLEVLRSGEPKLGIEEFHEGGAGERRLIRTDKFPLPNARGEFDRLVAVATDLTDLRRSEASLAERNAALQEVQRALDATSDAVLIVDRASGRFVFVNRGAQDQLGRSDAELRELGPEDINPEFDAVRLASVLDPLVADPATSARFRTVHRHASGHHVPVEVSVQFVPDLGERGRFIAIARDISETVALERRLEQRNVELERFLYTASHDLKSPLVTILGFTGHLETDVEVGRTEEIPYYVRRIRAATTRMRQNVDDLLELSRIGRTEFVPAPIDLRGSIEEILRQHEPRVEARGATIETRINAAEAWIDERHLYQVLDNLIGNALKYGVPNTGGRIVVGSDFVGDDEVVVWVADDGPGVEAAFANVVFEPFRRLGADGDGTGIGLAIVRRIAELYGGQAWVDETPGGGATFRVRLSRGERILDGE